MQPQVISDERCTIAKVYRWLGSFLIELPDPTQCCFVIQWIIRMWALQCLLLFRTQLLFCQVALPLLLTELLSPDLVSAVQKLICPELISRMGLLLL